VHSAGVDWLEPVAERPSGRFGTFVDPDGTYLQVIQFAKGPGDDRALITRGRTDRPGVPENRVHAVKEER
jgi:hypothetical protein